MGNGCSHRVIAGLAAAAAALAMASGAQAATFTVDDLGDRGDASTADGTCDTELPAGTCTLRAAIQQANASGGGDQVDVVATGTINLGTELPTISTPIDVNGPGPSRLTVRRDPGVTGNLRPFLIQSGTVMGASISGLTVTNGLNPQGGGIAIGGPVVATLRNVVIEGNASRTFSAQGGGIWVGGSLRLIDSTVRDNLAQAQTAMPVTPDGGSALGGGIFSSNDNASVIVRGSTISGNVTSATNAGGAGGHGGSSMGGGILVFGDLLLETSTVSGNVARDPGFGTGGGNPGVAWGGGVMVNNDRADILGSTIVLNNSVNIGSNLFAGNGQNPEVFLKSSIVAYGIGSQNCAEGPSVAADKGFFSQGYNLVGDASCSTAATGDLVGDPQLGPLADNGGPTRTHALPATSAAVDSGIRSGILDSLIGPTLTSNFTDQRGRARPFDFPGADSAAGGDGADIGAFERQTDDATATPPSGGGSPPPGGGSPPPAAPPADPDPGPPEEPSGPTPAEGDTLDPSTAIVKGPKRRSKRAKAKFAFGANEPAARFECRLIGGGRRAGEPAFKPCTSPRTYRRLRPGSYTFEVRATDLAGNVDASPARMRFRIV